MKSRKERDGLSLAQKLGYGLGDFGSNYCWSFVAGFIMIYCTNILGISAAVIGTIMMLSKVLDGISDLICGRIIDMTHSKMGKARFWYLVSTFPTAFSVFLLFNVPASFTNNTKYVYIFAAYTLMGAVFYTFNNIAYSSLVALCTKNPKDRVQMGSFRFIFALIGVILINSFTSALVEKFGGGQHGWFVVSIIYSIISMVFLLIPFFSVRELEDENTPQTQKQEKKKEISTLDTFKLLFKNRYFLLLLANYLITYLVSGITQGIGIYYATYSLGNAGLLGILSTATMFPVIIGLFFAPSITAKLGIRKTALWGSIIGLPLTIIYLYAGLNQMIGMFIAVTAIRTILGAPLVGGLNALVAEADDYSFLKFGHRVTGSIYSCSSVGIKVGTGLGTAVCGFIIENSGFNANAAVQSIHTVNSFTYAYIIPSVISAVLGVIILWLLNVEETNKKLREQQVKESINE